MKVNSKISLTWGVAAVFACAILYLLYMQSASVPRMAVMQQLHETQEKRSFDYDVWPPFQAPANEQHEQVGMGHVMTSKANMLVLLDQDMYFYCETFFSCETKVNVMFLQTL